MTPYYSEEYEKKKNEQKKILHFILSAGQYQSTEKCYKHFIEKNTLFYVCFPLGH